MPATHAVHGLVLTGGSSRRMGADKATVEVGGVGMAARVAGELRRVAEPVLAVGPEAGTGLVAVTDPGVGPLGALAAGGRALADAGCDGRVLLVACDLPMVTAELLAVVGEAGAGHAAAVPVAAGRDQPLAGCYAPEAVVEAGRLVERGERSMAALLDRVGAVRVAEADWTAVAPRWALDDVDTPGDLERARRRAGG